MAKVVSVGQVLRRTFLHLLEQFDSIDSEGSSFLQEYYLESVLTILNRMHKFYEHQKSSQFTTPYLDAARRGEAGQYLH